jgi:hypothetical protein
MLRARVKLGSYLFWIYTIGAMGACSQANSSPKLHTTISADGEMVATLSNAGTEQRLLRIRNLKTDTKWRIVQAPPLTTTIRFASRGHDLLLTYHQLKPKGDVLSRWNMDKPTSSIEKIFEAPELSFPIEVSPGRIMVRTRTVQAPGDTSKRFYLSGYHWILVGPSQQVQDVGPKPVLPYPAPNIVGTGFFWTEEQMSEKKDAHPQVLSYPLPGGTAPAISRERFEKNTSTVDCDQKAVRCLRRHVTNRDQKPAATYIYDVELLLGYISCKIVGVTGFSDGVSVTPDGRAAVMSLTSSTYDSPRHVVVMRFNHRQCEPTIIQHINFEEK